MNLGAPELLIVLLILGGPILVLVVVLVAVKTTRNKVPAQHWPAAPAPTAPPPAPGAMPDWRPPAGGSTDAPPTGPPD